MAYNPQMYQPILPNQTQNAYPNFNQLNQINQLTQPIQQPVQQMYQPTMNMPLSLSAAYIQGEIGARSYPVAAGNTVFLIDSDAIDTEHPIIYVKTTGYDGKPLPMRKIDGNVTFPNEQGLFVTNIVESKPVDIDLSEYTKKEDLVSFDDRIKSINERLNNFDEMMNNMNDTIANIDNRFSNMFNAMNNVNTSNNINNSNNTNNRNNKGNNRNGKGNN